MVNDFDDEKIIGKKVVGVKHCGTWGKNQKEDGNYGKLVLIFEDGTKLEAMSSSDGDLNPHDSELLVCIK